MNKKKIGFLISTIIAASGFTAFIMRKKAKKTSYKAEIIDDIPKRNMGLYEKHIKRVLDVICALSAIIFFAPLYIIVAILVKLKLGSPVLFTQDRPGLIGEDGKESIFKMYKFRTMTDERDENGNLLPDSIRLTKFGAWLRSTSLDELPEAFNILNGTMSVIGPRPLLVRDMTFMTKEQRQRHTAKPGLSGLAQVHGRNDIDWEDKLNWDLKYIKNVSFVEDFRIILQTVFKAFIKQEGITEENMATAEDFGDYLLRLGKISKSDYDTEKSKAIDILNKKSNIDNTKIDLRVRECAIEKKYSVLMSLYKKEKPEYLRKALDSMINQTVKPDEIVLVEDGPLTDELYAVLDEYAPYIKRVKNEVNLGLGLALNVGLKECSNELVARMDTDDCSKPDRCEKQLERFFEKPYLTVVGSHIDEFVGDISNVVSRRVVPTTYEDIYKFAKRRSAFNHPAVMYSKSRVLAVNGYSDLKRNQDVDLFGRILIGGGKAENIDESLLWFRSSDELAKRRKSWSNTWSYIDTIRKFWSMGYSSFADLAVVTIGQIGMFVMPVKVQHLIYSKFLRK